MTSRREELPMKKTRALAAGAVLTLALGAAACGDDDDDDTPVEDVIDDVEDDVDNLDGDDETETS